MGVLIKSKLRIKQVGKQMEKNAQKGLRDCIDDVVRTASQNAPHAEGILEKSWTKEVKNNIGTVSYTVKKKGGKGKKAGNFNYALKMHESKYNLGAGSLAKRGGIGMSGKQYKVGTGYLSQVIKGEEKTYVKHIEDMVKNPKRR